MKKLSMLAAILALTLVIAIPAMATGYDGSGSTEPAATYYGDQTATQYQSGDGVQNLEQSQGVVEAVIVEDATEDQYDQYDPYGH